MLTSSLIEQILATIGKRTIGVFGDLFLDRYLDLDAALTEPSIETGLDAYQVVRVRSYPGAAGTVINNLAALGVGRIVPVSMIGEDGEGYELRQALQVLPKVDLRHVVSTSARRTPTYTKPMLMKAESARELNRLDIKNRTPLPPDVETAILDQLAATWKTCDVWLVLDQVSEAECGVVTTNARARLAQLADDDASKVILVDSRERIGLFRNAWLKPNEAESLRATSVTCVPEAIRALAHRTGRPVICTRGEKGMLVAEGKDDELIEVPAFPVSGSIDTVGAGDSSSAAMACALASGASLIQAAAFGNLIASITIQQIGVTGSASGQQVRARWRELCSSAGKS